MYYPSTGADLDRADEASLRALELDPDLSEAHGARGFAHLQLKRLDEAEAEFKAAIAECRRQWEERSPDIVGLTAVAIRGFVDGRTPFRSR